MLNTHLEHLKAGPAIREFDLGTRVQFPEQTPVFLSFKYAGNEREKAIEYSKSERYSRVLVNLLTHYPAWKCDFDFNEKKYFFLLFGRTLIIDEDGLIGVRIGHPDDMGHATYLAAEILYFKNLSNIEVHVSCKQEKEYIEVGKTARVSVKKDLHSFKINTDNVDIQTAAEKFWKRSTDRAARQK
jgi:hypothetical protein